MKTLKTRLVTIAVLLCSTTVSAHDFKVDGIYYNITSESEMTVEVTYKGSTNTSAVYRGDVVIPENVVYNGSNYEVTGIGDDAFRSCVSLTEITIPSSVTSIGNSAFFYCDSLAEVTIPSSVTGIEDYAFFGCTSLPVENNVRYADTWAVEVTDQLQTSYALRPNTTGLASRLFEDCFNMTNIEVPNTVRFIGDLTFKGCCDLVGFIIPNSVVSIGVGVFDGCTGLTDITIPYSVKSFGSVGDCANLITVIIESQSVASKRDFYGCFGEQVTTYILGDSVTSIGNTAFFSCTGLTNITIPNSVTSIGESAF